ncbi:ABC transporter permease [Nonomuraea harbinensis]|uniref:ABC transporter permease n=1 Tax=Nonomuraea harbinensis TaxID=1286938 RepID=A0ABW1BTK5_9ACTN|nr:ABC transporter permease [Nonomuraea harbinensis]
MNTVRHTAAGQQPAAPPPGSHQAEQAGASSMTLKAVKFLGRYGTLLVLILLVVVFSFLDGSRFLSFTNFQNILLQSTISVVIALGLTVVLVVGEFDLSIGYTASLAGVLTAGLYAGSAGGKLGAIGLVIAVGALVGLVNGLIVTKLGVNALVGTLGIGSVVMGATYIVTAGVPQSLDASGMDLIQVYLGKLGPIPWPIVILFAVAGILWLLLNRTSLGLEWQAVGGNRTAAELSGIRVHRVVIFAFVVCGVLAAAGGVLITANVGSGQIAGGQGYLLSSFAAAFLGSACLRDGEFHVVGTVIGVVTVAVGFNGMAIHGVSTSAQFIFQGLLLIAAVGMSTSARRMVSGRRAGH